MRRLDAYLLSPSHIRANAGAQEIDTLGKTLIEKLNSLIEDVRRWLS